MSHHDNFVLSIFCVVHYMFLNTQLLEFDKFGASGLQVESTSRFVGNTLLAGAHDEGHEGGRLDLKDKEKTCEDRHHVSGSKR